jgi:DNA-binding transcriptional ArsR family regulator
VADLSTVRLDSRQIQVLAHPLRARLLGRLRLDGPATATRLAELLHTNTGATSYHLRQLADVGLVREDDRAARGRERWWRPAHDVTSWGGHDFAGDPDAAAAADWLLGYGFTRLTENYENWLAAARDREPAWREAADASDYQLALDPAQLRALTAELDAVVEKHRRAADDRPAPGAEQVLVYLYAFPRVVS